MVFGVRGLDARRGQGQSRIVTAHPWGAFQDVPSAFSARHPMPAKVLGGRGVAPGQDRPALVGLRARSGVQQA
jgi:hypothetical protein